MEQYNLFSDFFEMTDEPVPEGQIQGVGRWTCRVCGFSFTEPLRWIRGDLPEWTKKEKEHIWLKHTEKPKTN